MDTDLEKKIFTTSRAMLGNSTTSTAKVKMPKTCGKKMPADFQDIIVVRKLFYMGLESYEARYTLQLTEWNRRVFDRRG